MLYRTIFVFSIGLVLVKFVEMEQTIVEFDIITNKGNGKLGKLYCNNTLDKINKQKIKYTVLEGEDLTIRSSYKSFINEIRCVEINNSTNLIDIKTPITKNVFKVKVHKSMGTVWNCTVLTNRDTHYVEPIVTIENVNYSAAYCYMQLHVRRKIAPQTILVNNMVLEPNRIDLSVKDIDLTAVYNYADGDIVDVNCFADLKILKPEEQLSIKFNYADSLSSKFKSGQLSSSSGIGLRARLNPTYNNTDMICVHKGRHDLTTVSVKFIMQPKFDNIINIRINGMLIRPKLKITRNRFYEFHYKYINNEQLDLVCETDRDGVEMQVIDHQFDKITDKKATVSFKSNDKHIKPRCSVSNKSTGHVEESIEIYFEPKLNSNKRCKLHIDLPANNTVMELYKNDGLNIFLYEFEDGDKLTINCSSSCITRGPLTYVHFKDSDKWDSSSIIKDLHLIRQEKKNVTCYLKEPAGAKFDFSKDILRKEIRVLFEEKVLPTTTAPTTEGSMTPSPPPTTPAQTDPEGQPALMAIDSWILGLVGGVTCIVIICVSTVIFKLKKRNPSQRGPYDRNYVNLPTPSEASIPAHPVQWETDNYAVPVDQRREDNAIYSVPECPLYTTPVPKHARKKSKNNEPTYAILDTENTRTGPRNNFKDFGDSNYAEVRNLEACYAKVLPKNERTKQDNDPYSYVTNERTYANTKNVRPEAEYCEPGSNQRNQYANVMNDSRYANIPRQEYEEPAYCEPRYK